MIGRDQGGSIKIHAMGNKEDYDSYKTRFFIGGTRYRRQTKRKGKPIKPFTKGFIKPTAVHQRDCFEAGITFARNEGILPAPETTHAIKATIDEALKCKETGEEKTIVMNFSGHGMLDLKGYASYFEGTMQNAK